MMIVLFFALTTRTGELTIANISYVGKYFSVLIRSILLAGLVTLITLIIAYPFSYILSRMSSKTSRFVMLLAVLPMWVNFLLRTHAWLTILEKNGLLNRSLGFVGLNSLNIINTRVAVAIAMVYNYLPFMILPLFSTVKKINNSVIEAAQDLGAGSFLVFFKVIFPLSMPGVTSGINMVFVPAVSTFIISRMLGGSDNFLIGDLIDMQFLGGVYNPNVGAAISLILMVLTLLCMSILNQFGADDVEKDLV
jgi:spermidine/putrescine transport system permease protein